MQTIIDLAGLIAQVESSGNPYAVRFESHHVPFTKFILGMKTAAGCSTDTAAILCSTSWGLYQIMGDNLIDLGLNVSPIAYCNDPVKQLVFFKEFLRRNKCEYALDDILGEKEAREHFARIYNGPGNVQGYSQRIMQVAGASGLLRGE